MVKKKTLLSLVALSSFALAACDSVDDMTDNDTTTPPVEEPEDSPEVDEQEEDSSSADDYSNVRVMPEEVYDLFMEKYPEAVVTQIQLDKEMNDFVYEIEGFEGNTEYDLKVDSMDASVLKEDTDTDDDIDEMEITRDQVSKVTDLVDAALAEAGEDARLKEWTIDEDDGIVQLEIEMDTDGLGDLEHTYNVDTGDLIEKDD